MNLEIDLRVASDRMLRTLEQLQALENEKRTLQPGTERFQRLADEVERLAAEVFSQTHSQRQLGERAKVVTERHGAEITPIEEQESNRDLQLILHDWRDAERRLSLGDPDSAEHATAAADVGRLREEYHRAYLAGQRQPQER
jgi:hypothetical protein